MPRQESIPVAANILGTIGTVLWCIQLVPQIWRNYRSKTTEGLPASMMFIWATSAVPFGVYAIVQNLNIPIQAQAQVFGSLSLISWAQCLRYAYHWKVWTSTLLAVGTGLIYGGVEAALVLTLRPVYERGTEWPMLLIGIVASILLAAGLLPPYFEIWKRNGQVVGIDFVFLSIDWFGAFFSLMSLVAQTTFDYLGGSLYLICILLESGIFLSHWVWLFRTRKQRKVESEEGPQDVEAGGSTDEKEVPSVNSSLQDVTDDGVGEGEGEKERKKD